MRRVAEADRFVAEYPRWIVMLGIRPRGLDPDYGWIQRGDVLGCTASGPVWRVTRVLERPSLATAYRCLERGDLWSTLVVVAKVSTLVGAGRTAAPSLYRQIVQAVPLLGTEAEPLALRRAYARISASSFSGVVLDRSRQILAVSALTDARWRELGSPRRVAGSLRAADLSCDSVPARPRASLAA